MEAALRKRAAEEFARALRQAVPGRLRAVWLFGSVARGEDTHASDVDVLVVLDVRDPQVLRRIYTLANDLSMSRDVDLSVKVLGAADFERNRGTNFIENVHREGVALA